MTSYNINDKNLCKCFHTDGLTVFVEKYPDLDTMAKTILFDKKSNVLKYFINEIISTDSKDSFDIIKYIASKNGVEFHDLEYIATIYKNKKAPKDNLSKLFLYIYIYSKLNQVESSRLINVFSNVKCWTVVDFLHMQGLRAIDNDDFMKNIPLDKIDDMISKYNYTLARSNKAALTSSNILSLKLPTFKTVAELMPEVKAVEPAKDKKKKRRPRKFKSMSRLCRPGGRISSKRKTAINFNENYKKILKSKAKNITTLLDIVAKGDKISESELLAVIKNFLTVQKTKRQKKVKKTKSRVVETEVVGEVMDSVNDDVNDEINDDIEVINEANGINNHENTITEDKIIQLIDSFDKIAFLDIFDLHRALLVRTKFKIVTNLRNKNIFQSKRSNIDKRTIQGFIKNFIETNDIEHIKKFSELKYINLNTLSTMSEYMDFAMRINSDKYIDFFKDELKMSCSTNILYNDYRARRIGGKLKSKEYLELIKRLDKAEYPLNTAKSVALIIKEGDAKVISYLIEKKIEFPKTVITQALFNSSIDIVNILIKNGYTYTKKNMLDRLLRHFNAARWSYKPNKLQLIKFVSKKLEGTISSSGYVELIKLRDMKLLEYIHKTYPIEFNDANKKVIIEATNKLIMDYRNRWYGMDAMTKIVKYVEEKMGIPVLDKINIDEFVNKCIYNVEIDTLTYVVNKHNYVLTQHHLTTFLTNERDRCTKGVLTTDVVKFFESQNVTATYEIFLLTLTFYKMDVAKYLSVKYDFTFSQKQFHTMILFDLFARSTMTDIVDFFNLKITPYTLEIITQSGTSPYNTMALINHLFVNVYKLTQKTHDYIKNQQEKRRVKTRFGGRRSRSGYKMSNIPKAPTIIDYKAGEDEMPNDPIITAFINLNFPNQHQNQRKYYDSDDDIDEDGNVDDVKEIEKMEGSDIEMDDDLKIEIDEDQDKDELDLCDKSNEPKENKENLEIENNGNGIDMIMNVLNNKQNIIV